MDAKLSFGKNTAFLEPILVVSISKNPLGHVLKYCNFKEYYKCILLMQPIEDVLFLRRDVDIIFDHHRVMR